MNNPFTLSFGIKPEHYISRLSLISTITEDFKQQRPTNHVYMVTGVRGSGKTVALTNIADTFKKETDWIVVELNPTRDMLQALAANLYARSDLYPLFLKAKLDLSAFGLGVSIKKVPPITDIENALDKMLEKVKQAGKKLLILVDEVTGIEYVRVFATAFQIFMRKEHPVHLVMTGLYNNIYNLQNDRSLTFLYRAPKVILEPLNLTAIKKCYMDILKVDIDEAEKMSFLTKGYPFAFQVLGYLYWNDQDKKSIDDILPEYDQLLDQFVYSKIWSELSDLDRRIIGAIPSDTPVKVQEVRKKLEMSSNEFTLYRERLKNKGVIFCPQYGYVSFALPRFKEFAEARII